MKKLTRSLLALAALAAAQSSFAASGLIDSYSIEAGGGEHMQMARLAAQKDWNQDWFATSNYHLTGYWDANIAYWRANDWKNVSGANKNIAVIGLTPVFRWEAKDKKGLYADAGIGVSLFSSVYQNTDRHLSTAFEFADHVGAGYVFDNKWDLGLRLQHYSNGGIKHPNGGVNLMVLKASYHY